MFEQVLSKDAKKSLAALGESGLLKDAYLKHNFSGIKIADIKDIASMKIAAISDRGTKRDFIDLYFIIKVKKTLTLDEILRLYDKKFGLLKQNKIHILKSLCYFEDAEEEIMPKMLKDVSWRKIKKFFEGEIKKIKI